MSDIQIRTARSGDAARVATLLRQLGYPDNDIDAVRLRLDAWSREPRAEVLVADDRDRVIGVVAVVSAPYLEREGRWGRIAALVVDEAERGRGVARTLVEAAESAARNHGCTAMEVTSSNHRTDAHSCYEKLGYENLADRSGRFFKHLPDREPEPPDFGPARDWEE